MEDVLERALEYYRDRHPKQQGFTFLHCWTLLREVPRWWKSPLNVQKRTHGGEGSPGGLAMAAWRAAMPMQPAHEGDVQKHVDGEGAIAKGEGLGSVESAARELVRPRGKRLQSRTFSRLGAETLSSKLRQGLPSKWPPPTCGRRRPCKITS